MLLVLLYCFYTLFFSTFYVHPKDLGIQMKGFEEGLRVL